MGGPGTNSGGLGTMPGGVIGTKLGGLGPYSGGPGTMPYGGPGM